MKKILLLILIIISINFVNAEVICEYAGITNSTSQNVRGSLAVYATGMPDARTSGECRAWSGYGYSWTPANWNVRANLTLKYEKGISVKNLSVIGDYDMCLSGIWLKNSSNGEIKKISNGNDNRCNADYLLDNSFIGDTVILQSCGWSWSAVDAVQMCGETQSLDNVNSDNKIEKPVYIAPYVGDIDGNVAEWRWSFYSQLIDFFDTNKINGGFSFYPGTLKDRGEFVEAFARMYESENIELIQKGYLGDEREMTMDELDFNEQKQIILEGQDSFRSWIRRVLSINNPKIPISYDQIGARFTSVTKSALEELGFKVYFDVYVGDGLQAISSTDNFDVIQYGISFTTTGGSGENTIFKNSDEIIQEINSFSRNDLDVIEINNVKMIPLFVHQQDFMKRDFSGIEQDKWETYTETLLKLKNDANVRFFSPSEIYNLRHQNEICQYAISAFSNSVRLSLAAYATGEPDARTSGECRAWSGYGYSWTPANWNVRANLTLKYEKGISVKNLSVIGDYDMCLSGIWLKNSSNGEIKKISNGNDNRCNADYLLDNSFIGDTVILQSCGWSWSAVDAVQMCGNVPEGRIDDFDNDNRGNDNNPEENLNLNAEICRWKNCNKGAVSFSTDHYTSCMDKLEAKGYRGTYFLADTNSMTTSLWRIFDNAFKKGHEIGTHTRNHWCVEIPETQFVTDVENNIRDITTRTSVKREELVSHAQPCGFTTARIQDKLKSNWNFILTRGYNFNELEDSSPGNFFDLKSFNSKGYPGGNLEPSNYKTIIDLAENEGKWTNLVFHNECNDDSVIDYLPSKDLWVDTTGNVARYIYLRDNSEVRNFIRTDNKIEFAIDLDDRLKNNLYNQNLTLFVNIGNANAVKVNGKNIIYRLIGNKVMFDVPFPIDGRVEVFL